MFTKALFLSILFMLGVAAGAGAQSAEPGQPGDLPVPPPQMFDQMQKIVEQMAQMAGQDKMDPETIKQMRESVGRLQGFMTQFQGIVKEMRKLVPPESATTPAPATAPSAADPKPAQ